LKLTFIQHLQHNWPLALAAAALLVYLPVVLIGGVFYTNQGPITRQDNPAGYWGWVRKFFVLLLGCLAVLAGSYLLDPAH
jgi:hypothetical protein